MMLGIGVTACGGGGGGNNDNPVSTTYSIKSFVQNIDGEGISSAVVCLDVNGDAACTDADAEVKTSDSTGAAIHSFTEDQVKAANNMIAVLSGGKVYSGVLTESALVGLTKASSTKSGKIYLNPVTTQLVKYAKSKNISHSQAAKELARIMNVNASDFSSSIVKDSPLDVIIRSLESNNDSLSNSAVVDAVADAGTKVGEALNNGVSADSVVSSYNEYGNFDHIGEHYNNPPVITQTDMVQVSCRTYLFTASATDADGDELSYSWKFDDNASVKGVNVEHVFASNGTHGAVLTVSDGHDSVTKDMSIDVNSNLCGTDLKALYTFKTDELTVSFSNVSTGDIAKYEWDFGDESKSTEQNPVHQYAKAGKYVVSLIVTDVNGNKSEVYSYEIEVSKGSVVDPKVNTVVNGLSVTLSTDDVENPVWIFSDGTQLSGSPVTKTFEKSGIYPVTLMYGKNSKTFDVTVAASNDPVVTIAEPVVSGLNVNLSASAVNAPSSSSFVWNMGDGSTVNGSQVVHTYETAGTYTVTVSLVDSKGKVLVTDSKNVTVAAPNKAPVADFVHVIDGVSVKFTNSSSDPDGDSLTYEWNFGDNSAVSHEKSPTHVYAEVSASYTVKLTVSDGKLTDSKTVTVPVIYTPPVINHAPVAVSEASVSNMVLTFDAGMSSDEDGDSLIYAWNFGDGSVSTLVSGTHQYANPGTYTVTLVVSDGKLSSTPLTKTFTVEPNGDVINCTLE